MPGSLTFYLELLTGQVGSGKWMFSLGKLEGKLLESETHRYILRKRINAAQNPKCLPAASFMQSHAG